LPSPSCWYRLLVCGYYSLDAAKGWGVVAIVADSPKRPHRAPGYPGDDGRPDDLNDLEREMLGAAQTGELLRREGPFDLESMQAWGTDRSIRAGTLRQLLVAAQGQVHAKGVRLQGVLISGQLDLESATLPWTAAISPTRPPTSPPTTRAAWPACWPACTRRASTSRPPRWPPGPPNSQGKSG